MKATAAKITAAVALAASVLRKVATRDRSAVPRFTTSFTKEARAGVLRKTIRAEE